MAESVYLPNGAANTILNDIFSLFELFRGLTLGLLDIRGI